MDSISHTRVARILLGYVEETCGVTFDQTAFYYGNLKPDLTGTYLTKRHYPSLMFDEVMEKIRTFVEKYTIYSKNGRELSTDLGEICHYITDFFTYPHNDDIYHRSLLAHYIYEKRISARIGKRIDEEKFENWVSPIVPPFTADALIERIKQLHQQYITKTGRHCIANDMVYISKACAMVMLSIVNIAYVSEPVSTETPAAASVSA